MSEVTAATLAGAVKHVQVLPDDGLAGALVGRVWVGGVLPGPAVVALRPEGVFDLSEHYPTMSTLLDTEQPAEAVRRAPGRRLCSVDELLANSLPGGRNEALPWLLAPCDLQVVKAAGVTFAASLIERVIEEQARGDASRAQGLRDQVIGLIGESLADIRPGSSQAIALKALLQQKGLWSQYLEVGIGPDAEVFTKAPVLASVGCGEDIGIRADSAWNNPEPEVVLAAIIKILGERRYQKGYNTPRGNDTIALYDISAVIEVPDGFALYLAKEKTTNSLSAALLSIPKRSYEQWLIEQPPD